jgi:hypothetical protein
MNNKVKRLAVIGALVVCIAIVVIGMLVLNGNRLNAGTGQSDTPAQSNEYHASADIVIDIPEGGTEAPADDNQ